MTAQVPDTITLWDGTRGALLNHPGFGSGVVQTNELPGRLRLVLEDTTALGRGYVAHWQVRGRELWLCGIDGSLRLAAGCPLMAEWVSTEVRVGIGQPPESPLDLETGNHAVQVRMVVDEGVVESAWRIERVL